MIQILIKSGVKKCGGLLDYKGKIFVWQYQLNIYLYCILTYLIILDPYQLIVSSRTLEGW